MNRLSQSVLYVAQLLYRKCANVFMECPTLSLPSSRVPLSYVLDVNSASSRLHNLNLPTGIIGFICKWSPQYMYMYTLATQYSIHVYMML